MKNINQEAEPKFMEFFFTMGPDEKEVIRKWYCGLDFTKSRSKAQEDFLNIIRHAFLVCDTYKIATIEPYVVESDEPVDKIKIDFGIGEKPCWDFNIKLKLDIIPYIREIRSLGLEDCDFAASSFAPEYKSGLATLEELFLWYAYRIATGYWTLEYVCDDSSSDGNYDDSPTASHELELAGQRCVGGFRDGIGNMYKIIEGREDFQYGVVGGMYICSGKKYQVASYEFFDRTLYGYGFWGSGVPVVVLRK